MNLNFKMYKLCNYNKESYIKLFIIENLLFLILFTLFIFKKYLFVSRLISFSYFV